MTTIHRQLATLGLLALGAAPAAGAQGVERRTLSGNDVAVYNLVGVVRVEGGTGSEVAVEVTPRGADARRLSIASGDLRGRNTLRVMYPDRRIVYPQGRWGWGSRVSLHVDDDGTFDGDDRGGRRVDIVSRGDGLEAWADVKVIVPKGKRVAVHLAAGDAVVENVDGDILVDVHAASVTTNRTKGILSLDTGSGEVRVTDAEGELDLDTGSGSVEITRVRGSRLRLDTGSGRVRGTDITAPELDLDTGSGSVRLANLRSDDIVLDSGSGSIELGLLSDVSSLRIDSGSGGVTIRAPEVLGAEFVIETGSGDIDFDFPVQIRKRERGYLSGSIGDGKGRIAIETGSGGVRFLRQ